MNHARLNKIEKNLEKKMTLEQRFAWIARSFSSCEDLDEYLQKGYAHADRFKSDPLRQQKICVELEKKKGTATGKKTDSPVFLCDFRVRLATRVNVEIEELIPKITGDLLNNSILIVLDRAQTRLQVLEDTEENQNEARSVWRLALEIFGQFRQLHAPRVEGYQKAITRMKYDYFEGCSFLTRSNALGMESLEIRVKDFVEMLAGSHDFRSAASMSTWEKDVDEFADDFFGRMVDTATGESKAELFGDYTQARARAKKGIANQLFIKKCMQDELEAMAMLN